MKSYIQRKEAATGASADKSSGKSLPARTGYPSPVQLKENKTGLPDQLKSGVESLSGMFMDHVRVKYESQQPAQLGALAYAQGSQIHVGPGQEHHLPHEAWHLVQQADRRVKPDRERPILPYIPPEVRPASTTPSVTPTLPTPPVTPIKATPISTDASLEREADIMGAKAAAKPSRFSKW
jgi:hypothetical protein